MNKKDAHTSEWSISDMASHLPEHLISDLEPAGSGDPLSPEAVRRLALQKRKVYLQQQEKRENGNEETPVKKVLFRTLLVAAIVCATSITVFAATGGLEYIKQIFGDSAQSIQHEIVTPHVTGAANGREMAVEAMVTDGYVGNIVVSLTGTPPDTDDLFRTLTDTEMYTTYSYPIEEFSTPDKTYYVVGFTTLRRFDSASITVSLNKDVAPIDLSFSLDNNLGNAVFQFPEDAVAGPVHLKELQISPMGFLLAGGEEEAKGGLPSTTITVVFRDGSTEDMEVEFDDGGGETISGGGGVILPGPGQQAPLVTSFQGTRNPDGEVVITGQFSRIIDPEKIEKVIIFGEEYPVG